MTLTAKVYTSVTTRWLLSRRQVEILHPTLTHGIKQRRVLNLLQVLPEDRFAALPSLVTGIEANKASELIRKSDVEAHKGKLQTAWPS